MDWELERVVVFLMKREKEKEKEQREKGKQMVVLDKVEE